MTGNSRFSAPFPPAPPPPPPAREYLVAMSDLTLSDTNCTPFEDEEQGVVAAEAVVAAVAVVDNGE